MRSWVFFQIYRMIDSILQWSKTFFTVRTVSTTLCTQVFLPITGEGFGLWTGQTRDVYVSELQWRKHQRGVIRWRRPGCVRNAGVTRNILFYFLFYLFCNAKYQKSIDRSLIIHILAEHQARTIQEPAVFDWLIDWTLIQRTYPFYRMALGQCSVLFSEGVTAWGETGQCCHWIGASVLVRKSQKAMGRKLQQHASKTSTVKTDIMRQWQHWPVSP
jgi:hypothetical protein